MNDSLVKAILKGKLEDNLYLKQYKMNKQGTCEKKSNIRLGLMYNKYLPISRKKVLAI